MSVQYKTADGWKNISSSSNNAVDTVENGNMNPVTSNAVYDALNTIKPRSGAGIGLAANTALPSEGLTYTASADGLLIVHAYKKSGGNTLHLFINNNVVDDMPFHVPTLLSDCYGCQIRLTGFVRRGDTVKISSDGNQSLYWIQTIIIQPITWTV